MRHVACVLVFLHSLPSEWSRRRLRAWVQRSPSPRFFRRSPRWSQASLFARSVCRRSLLSNSRCSVQAGGWWPYRRRHHPQLVRRRIPSCRHWHYWSPQRLSVSLKPCTPRSSFNLLIVAVFFIRKLPPFWRIWQGDTLEVLISSELNFFLADIRGRRKTPNALGWGKVGLDSVHAHQHRLFQAPSGIWSDDISGRSSLSGHRPRTGPS